MRSVSRGSTPPATFDALYARDPDPWGFETSLYEKEKYSETLAALQAKHFHSGLEVGCSIGVLTRLLADRCEQILAIDVAGAALAQARRRCRDVPQVRFRRAVIPAEWPEGTFDLVVMSEILYFLGAEDIASTAQRTMESLEAGGSVLLVNYLGPTDTSCDGETAAQIFIDAALSGRPSLRKTLQRRHPRYRLDVLQG